MEDQEQLQVARLQELRSAIAAGVASGSGRDADVVFSRLSKKFKAVTAKAKG